MKPLGNSIFLKMVKFPRASDRVVQTAMCDEPQSPIEPGPPLFFCLGCRRLFCVVFLIYLYLQAQFPMVEKRVIYSFEVPVLVIVGSCLSVCRFLCDGPAAAAEIFLGHVSKIPEISVEKRVAGNCFVRWGGGSQIFLCVCCCFFESPTATKKARTAGTPQRL